MTYYCSACDVCWWKYMTENGACPECGGGTVRKQEPGSFDADARYKAALAARNKAADLKAAHERFEKYAAEHDAALMAAQLAEIEALPVVEPRRAA